MRYLVCDGCHGYYELKTDESPEDFLDKCECGGNLKYTPSLDLDDATENIPENDGYKHIKEDFNQKQTHILEVSNLDMRITRLIIGILIVLVPNFIFIGQSNLLFFAFYGIPLFLAGFVSSLFVEGKITDGILNGTRVGLFSGLIYLALASIIFLIYSGFNFNTLPDLGLVILSFVILILFTSVGGFLGVTTHNMLLNRRKEIVKEEVKESVTDTKDPAESKYHEAMVKLGYRQVAAINSGEKIFKDLISDRISEKDAIAQLKADQTVAYEVLKEMKKITPPLRYMEYHQLKVDATKDICRTFEIIDGLVCNDESKIQKTNNLVENSTIKVNEAIAELHKTMKEDRFY